MAGSPVASDRTQRVVGACMTIHELLLEFASIVPHGHARRLIGRARRVAGIDRTSHAESLEIIELLMILEAIASEGGRLQVHAEVLARRTLYEGALYEGALYEGAPNEGAPNEGAERLA